MMSPREGSTRRAAGRRLVLWASLAATGALPALVGCQAEYAGMTLPSGKYLYDDVQYFAPGPEFPWANTNAATQRARMQAMGMDVGTLPVPGMGGPITPPTAAGALDPTQMRGAASTNVNTMLNPPGGPEIAPPPAPGQGVPAPVPQPGEENVPPPGGVR